MSDINLVKKGTDDLIAAVKEARDGVIKTMDAEPLTRESAVAAIDAGISETLRLVNSGTHSVMAVVIHEEKDDLVKLEGLADAYFDAINS